MPLPEDLAEHLLTAVVDGRHPAGSALPPEGELAATYQVSRLTVREAVRILRAKNVLEVHRGRGTFVNPPDRWTSLEALVRVHSRTDSGLAVAERLLEARRMVEVGAAHLAAVHRTDEDLDQLRACLQEMETGSAGGDVDLFVEADIAFHDVVMRASGNIFVPFMFEPFGDLLVHTRRQTSAVPEIQTHAIGHHAAVLAALERGDATASRDAMDAHMTQTLDDLRRHVAATTLHSGLTTPTG